MNLQEIIVIIVVGFCFVYVGGHFLSYFKRTRQGTNPCESCMSDCALRKEIQENNRKKKKNRCG